MVFLLKNGGEPKIINTMKAMQCMIGAFLSLSLASCSGQSNDSGKLAQNGTKQYAADTSKPKISYKVNKEYDDKGNLIRFDSTYSYVYSGAGSSFGGPADSLLKTFRFDFPSRLSLGDSTRSFFSDPFFSDPFFKNGFPADPFRNSSFGTDFLKQQMEFHQRMLKEMQQRMERHKAEPLKKEQDDASVTRQI
jgi:hypothetical protein